MSESVAFLRPETRTSIFTKSREARFSPEIIRPPVEKRFNAAPVTTPDQKPDEGGVGQPVVAAAEVSAPPLVQKPEKSKARESAEDSGKEVASSIGSTFVGLALGGFDMLSGVALGAVPGIGGAIAGLYHKELSVKSNLFDAFIGTAIVYATLAFMSGTAVALPMAAVYFASRIGTWAVKTYFVRQNEVAKSDRQKTPATT